MRLKSKKIRAGLIIAIALCIIYLCLAEFTLQASLNPSFMEKLDAFSSFTQKGYAEQVQSSEIDKNAEESSNETYAWLSEMSKEGWVKYKTESSDGYELVASVFTQKDEIKAGAPWVMILHGYTGWKEEMYPYAYRFYMEGYNVIVPDMRAQGESGGKYIGLGWEDRLDNMKWLGIISEKYPDSDIVIFGLSMGGTASLILGAEDLPSGVKCIIADSAFADAKEMFKYKFRDWIGLPTFGLVDSAGFLLKLQGGYDINMASGLKAVKKAKLPVLFIGGTEDKTVPIENLYSLYDACVFEKQKLVIEGAGHGQCADKDPQLYWDTVFEFAAVKTGQTAGKTDV